MTATVHNDPGALPAGPLRAAVAHYIQVAKARCADDQSVWTKLGRGNEREGAALEQAWTRLRKRSHVRLRIAEDWCDLIGTHGRILYGGTWDRAVMRSDSERHGTEARYGLGCPCGVCVRNHERRQARRRVQEAARRERARRRREEQAA